MLKFRVMPWEYLFAIRPNQLSFNKNLHSGGYTPSPYFFLLKVFKALNYHFPKVHFSALYDLGCGTGRALIVSIRLIKADAYIGYEADTYLFNKAKKLLRKFPAYVLNKNIQFSSFSKNNSLFLIYEPFIDKNTIYNIAHKFYSNKSAVIVLINNANKLLYTEAFLSVGFKILEDRTIFKNKGFTILTHKENFI